MAVAIIIKEEMIDMASAHILKLNLEGASCGMQFLSWIIRRLNRISVRSVIKHGANKINIWAYAGMNRLYLVAAECMNTENAEKLVGIAASKNVQHAAIMA